MKEVWLLPPTDSGFPGGGFVLEEEGLQILAPHQVVVTMLTKEQGFYGYVEVPVGANVVRANIDSEQTPLWVWWGGWVFAKKGYTLGAVVASGGYHAFFDHIGNRWVLGQWEYFTNLPPIIIPLPTKARGYTTRYRSERPITATPLTPDFLHNFGPDARIVEQEANYCVIVWTLNGREYRTRLERKGNTWEVAQAGFCVNGADRNLPPHVVRAIAQYVGHTDEVSGQIFVART